MQCGTIHCIFKFKETITYLNGYSFPADPALCNTHHPKVINHPTLSPFQQNMQIRTISHRLIPAAREECILSMFSLY